MSEDAGMLAARAYPHERAFRLEQVEIPSVREGEVLVKVGAAGVSRGLLSLWRFTDMIKLLPATLGNEIAGTVWRTGPGVKGLELGQRVRVHAPLTCGHCSACSQDCETMCAELAIVGFALYSPSGMEAYARYHHGGLADFVRVPAGNVDVLPDEVSLQVGCKLGTLATSWRAVRQAAAASVSGTLLVTGATGASGAAAAACAPVAGFERVIAVARSGSALAGLQRLAPHVTDVIATEDLEDRWEVTGH